MTEYDRYIMPLPNGVDDTLAFVTAFNSTAVGTEIRLHPKTYRIKPDHPTLVFWGRKWLGSYLHPNPKDGQGTIIKPVSSGTSLAHMAGMGEVRNIQFDAEELCERALWYSGHVGLVKSCHFKGGTVAGAYMDGATSKLEDCRASHSGVGILARGANAGMILNCSADYNVHEGLLVEGAWSPPRDGKPTHGGSVRVIGGGYAQNGTDLSAQSAQVVFDGVQNGELSSAYLEGLPGNNGGALLIRNTTNACSFSRNVMSAGITKAITIEGINCVNNVFSENRGNNGPPMTVTMPGNAWAHANIFRDNVMSSHSGGVWKWNIGGFVVELWPWGPSSLRPPIVNEGGWPKGMRLYNLNPSPITPLGWVCTTTGFPGSWIPFGA